METVKFGNVEIKEIEANTQEGSSTYGLRTFRVFIDGKRTSTLRCNEIDLVILYAMSIKYEGLNGHFGYYAGKMLSIREDVWVGWG